MLVACNSDSKSEMDTKKEIVTDTSTQYKNNVNTDTPQTVPAPVVAPLPDKAATSTEAYRRKETKRTTRKVTTAPVPETAAETPVTTTTTNSTATTPVVTPEKKA